MIGLAKKGGRAKLQDLATETGNLDQVSLRV
jgi:hypothetical protein